MPTPNDTHQGIMSPTNKTSMNQQVEEAEGVFRPTHRRTAETEQVSGKLKKRKISVDRNPNRTEPIGPNHGSAHPPFAQKE